MSDLRIGDKVIMNERYHVADENKGKVFAVRSKPWMACGDMVVKISGKAGGYAVDGLTKVKDAKYVSAELAYQFGTELLKKETGAYSKGWNNGLRALMSALRNDDALPAVEVRQVTFCEDCGYVDLRNCCCQRTNLYMNEDDFCSRAKAMED